MCEVLRGGTYNEFRHIKISAGEIKQLIKHKLGEKEELISFELEPKENLK